MFIACLLLYFVRYASSTSAVAEVTWYSAPNFRGTWDLVASCVLTLVICVWSALHLNVPVIGSKLKDRNLRRLRWILLGIFAPEVVVSTAFAQYLTARWLMHEIQGDVKYRRDLVSILLFLYLSNEVSKESVHLMTDVHRQGKVQTRSRLMLGR